MGFANWFGGKVGSRGRAQFGDVRIPAFEELEPRLLLNGVTVLTHGEYDDASTWMNGMSDAIVERIVENLGYPTNDSLVAVYTLTVGDSGTGPSYNMVQETDWAVDETTTGEMILKIDWSEYVNYGYQLGAEEIGAAVAAYLAAPSPFGIPLLASPFHLIGHDYGAMLNTIIAEEIGKVGAWVDQVTTIAPQRSNYWEMGYPVWENIRYADNYWTASVEGIPLGGVVGAHNTTFFEGHFDSGGYAQNDSANLHLWYHGTIDTDVDANDSVEDVPTDWYSSGYGPRTTTGYHYSRIGGADRSSVNDGMATGSNRDMFQVRSSAWANLDARLNVSSTNFTVGDPVNIGYLYQSTLNPVTIVFALDNDQNPFNDAGLVEYIGAAGNPATGDGTTYDPGSLETYIWDTSYASTGTYYLRVAEGSGAGNYSFVVLVDGSPPVSLGTMSESMGETLASAGTECLKSKHSG